ncbi:proline-rich protein 2-like [Trichechus manatus latirostris]|uniref:Proline-rich protein 2-like n=1 Tax=Trichechus manatus latirostris TaxID=127582 RepID=A0A2Y9G090_TRIMA|nr:proline-rich protein 2-like [Trichechus manatus latirostris]
MRSLRPRREVQCQRVLASPLTAPASTAPAPPGRGGSGKEEEGGGVASLHPVRPLRKVLSSGVWLEQETRAEDVNATAPPAPLAPELTPLRGQPPFQSGNPGGTEEGRDQKQTPSPRTRVTCRLSAPQRAKRSRRGPPTARCAAGGRLFGAGRAGEPRSGGDSSGSQGDSPRAWRALRTKETARLRGKPEPPRWEIPAPSRLPSERRAEWKAGTGEERPAALGVRSAGGGNYHTVWRFRGEELPPPRLRPVRAAVALVEGPGTPDEFYPGPGDRKTWCATPVSPALARRARPAGAKEDEDTRPPPPPGWEAPPPAPTGLDSSARGAVGVCSRNRVC